MYLDISIIIKKKENNKNGVVTSHNVRINRDERQFVEENYLESTFAKMEIVINISRKHPKYMRKCDLIYELVLYDNFGI